MSYLPQTKFGDCANPLCGAKNTEVVKVGKELFCIFCRKDQKTKVQITKANERNRIRGLHGRQVEEGNEGDATRAYLISDLDWVASRVVRLRAADERGNLGCYTCLKTIHWSMADCSHFVSRKCLMLRWDLVYNLKPSCKKCNQQEYGNLEVFAQKLELEHKGIIEILQEKSREIYKPDLSELKQLLIDLRAKLKPLESKFNTTVKHIEK